MALDQSALLELSEALRTADGGELMRRLLHTMLQAVIDAEATAHIGAGPHERTETRSTQRNGTREKLVATTAGDLTVKIPKVRSGSFFPSLLAPRRRIDVALHAVVMQAWVEGVSIRKVDDLVAALGVESGISKSEVSRICAGLDTEVAAWRARPLDEQPFPYVFLDATYCKARVGGRVVSRAVVIATGVSADGRREVLGCDVGDSENEVFWTGFLRELRDRGLSGVQLVISDSHRGLTNAIDTVLTGAAWQRCRVHFSALRARPGQQGTGGDGCRGDPHHLRPAHRRHRPSSGAERRGHPETAVPRRGDAAARRPRGDHRLRRLSAGPLAQDLVDQPAGTAEQGGQAAHRRRRHLPRRQRPPPTRQLRAHRGPRRMAGLRPPLPLRGLHGPAHPARTHRPRTHRPRTPPHRPQRGDRPARLADGIVSTTAEQHADELHHPTGRDPTRRPCQRRPGPFSKASAHSTGVPDAQCSKSSTALMWGCRSHGSSQGTASGRPGKPRLRSWACHGPGLTGATGRLPVVRASWPGTGARHGEVAAS